MNDDKKKAAAERAVEFVEAGQIVGLGTGSTVFFALEALGRRVREGLDVTGVPTSSRTESLARERGIPLIDLNDAARIDITIDGADQVDSEFNMIKGGGGALTREKLVAAASDCIVIAVDDSKLVESLGAGFPVPVEVVPFGWRTTVRRLEKLGCEARLRTGSDGSRGSDNGNYIVDCDFGSIADPPSLAEQIKLITGVVECGLFIGLVSKLTVGRATGVDVITGTK